MAQGFGLRFSRTLSGRPPITKRFSVPSTDGTALYKGDVVKLVNTMDANGEFQTITRAATGNILLGVIAGFKADGVHLVTGNIREASTARLVDVIVDPEAIYEAQEDAVGGSVTAAQLGAMDNVNIVVAAGSSGTGVSGTMIDSSTTTTSAADLKLVGIAPDGGVNVAASTNGSVLEVMILAPAIKATQSQS